MARLKWRKNVNVGKVVVKVVTTVIALYVGGFLMMEFGAIMNGTSSPFYKGLTLIGWTVGLPPTNGTAGWYYTCGEQINRKVANGVSTLADNNCITSTSGSGVLAVIGIVAIASIVTEFVEFSM